jgi:pimeloyl-ACP methyl ester carboxylesterase
VKNVASRDGTTIAYDENGDGPALILVDGALSTRLGGCKAELVEHLAPHFTVFRYDRRGRGDSGDTPPYAVEREIEDIEALIDQAGGAAFLYGHSSGGCLALEAARTLRAKVTRIALYERRTTTIRRPNGPGPSTSASSPKPWRPTAAVTRWRCSGSTREFLPSRSPTCAGALLAEP